LFLQQRALTAEMVRNAAPTLEIVEALAKIEAENER
jgi:hypothetical protein